MLVITLAFFNPSRSFDETRSAVRFFGHDGMFEVRFFIEAAALLLSDSNPRERAFSEAECLTAFDAQRSSIHDAARKAYASGGRSSYTLTPAHFR